MLNEESEAVEDSGQGEVRLIFKVDTIELVAAHFSACPAKLLNPCKKYDIMSPATQKSYRFISLG